MTISFNDVPQNIRVPFLSAEFDPSAARPSSGSQPFKNLLIGQKTAAGTAVADVPVRFTTSKQAEGLFGAGSMLHLMAIAALLNDPLTECWAIPLVDNGAGVAAAGTITVTGPATAAGTISLYIAGQLVEVGVANGDAQNTIAAAINSAINAKTSLPVTSTVLTNAVTWAAKNKGTGGNDVDPFHNYHSDEALPAGVGLAYASTATGATDPTVTALIAAMANYQFNCIANPYLASTQLNALEAELELRWGPMRQQEGHMFSFKDDTHGNLTTFGAGRNSKHTSCVGVYKSPSPGYVWAAALMGTASPQLQIDPARPLQTVVVKGVLAPKKENRFSFAERNLLLYDGIATVSFDEDGTSRIERLITTYQTNAAGADDVAFLDVEKKFTLSYIRWDWNNYLATKYPRHKLAKDGTNFSAGQKVMTPKLGKAEAVARFRSWEERGLVEDADQFIADLIVEINAADPDRMDWKLSPNLINQLRGRASQFAFLL